jgi:hypothetical protein
MKKSLLFCTATLIYFFAFSQDNNTGCVTSGGSGCSTGGNSRGTLSAPTFTWQYASFSGSNTDYFVIPSLAAGDKLQFATSSGQDLETAFYHEDGSNLVVIDADYDCADCTQGVTPNSNDESGVYTTTKAGNHRVRLSKQGQCSNMNNNSNMRFYYRLLATALSPLGYGLSLNFTSI